ncbi:MAG: hypothetical protein D4Q79_02360 [Spirochaetia bacterium]|nr:MAG: hypothetical protein D4Q79_02360 [Spirochaetia bacterium]
MNLTKQQIDLLSERKVVALATSGANAVPRVIFVEVNSADEDEIIITDNFMETTKKNILENKKVSILSFKEDYSYCFRIFGEAEYHTEGKYFDFVRGLETNKDYSPKGAVVVKIKEIFEFE